MDLSECVGTRALVYLSNCGPQPHYQQADRGHHGDPPLEISLNVTIMKLPWFKVGLLETSEY